MKPIIHILFLILTAQCCGQTRMSATRFKTFSGIRITDSLTIKLTLTTGQSNSLSGGRNLNSTFTSNPLLSKHFDSTTSTFPTYVSSVFAGGFETQTAGLQGVIRSDTIYQVRVGEGSQDIFQFSKTDQAKLWVNLKRNIDSANAVVRRSGKKPVWISAIWLQGEQNINVATPQATYQAKLDSLITNIRALDPSMSNMQWVMVKIRSDQTFSANPVTPINTSFDNIVSTRSNCAVIDPVSISANFSDLAHYDNGGYIKIANAWSSLIP